MAARMKSSLAISACPTPSKFDANGQIVSTQSSQRPGRCRIDPRTGDKTVLANLTPGLDNVTFVGKRTFVSSNISATSPRSLTGGQTRDLIADGLQLATRPRRGRRRFGVCRRRSVLLQRCVRDSRDSKSASCSRPAILDIRAVWLLQAPVSSSSQQRTVTWRATRQRSTRARCWPAVSINSTAWPLPRGGAVIFVEQGTGSVHSVHSGNVETLATGLNQPSGVAVSADGTCYVTESASWPRAEAVRAVAR